MLWGDGTSVDAPAEIAMREEMAAWERQAATALGALLDPVERGARLLAAGLPTVYGPELGSLRDAAEQLSVTDIADWFLRSVTGAPNRSRSANRNG